MKLFYYNLFITMCDLEMKLDTIYYDYILEGKKIYETRVYDDKRQKIKLKDVVLFKDVGSKRTFKATITELSYFKTFKEAIESSGVKKILPNAKSVDDAIKLYEGFPHSTGNYKKGAKKYGVLRLKFTL